jgi:hypothetical protein
MSSLKVRGDFNGLFGDLLCLSHTDSCLDEHGATVQLQAGMRLTAIEEDYDATGARDDLIATGVVEPSPPELSCLGSRWALRIEPPGVHHQSDLT